jgi:hypothetical protein
VRRISTCFGLSETTRKATPVICPAIVDDDVLILDVADLLETLAERCDAII